MCLILPSAAESRLLGPVLSLVQENDLVVNTDRHYTQGLRLNFLAEEAPATADGPVERLARVLPSGTVEFEGVRWGLGVGQLIFTPRDLAARRLQRDDRPYAGYLFAAFVLQRRGHSERFAGVLDHVELDLGVIGPESLAEEAQNTVHRVRGFPLARGWHNQLETEPGAALRIARAARLAFGDSSGLAAEALPYGGASLGNVGTFAALGVRLRAGWRLPDDFGGGTIEALVPVSGGRRSDGGIGWLVFVDLGGHLVAYNAFLDGNVFHDSHGVTAVPYVGDLQFGAALTVSRIEVGYAQVIRSREFEGQRGADSFGSLRLALRW